MIELLRAVQENVMQNQAPQFEEPATGGSLTFNKLMLDFPAVSVLFCLMSVDDVWS